ncbi:MAG: 16S rRNA (adenine(1518)-N(6)/adenine(1519)-N(6))-dimethyltransferase RsmA [Clostridiales bacterium]|nr:16S rRNA (adenine(1518)-N(6)/adenine(1519)-N(6))-dimethyltransferase RsmA [Clostridiales bacterium]
MNKRETQALLGQFAIRPQHRLGQNFLVDDNLTQRILDAAQVSEQDLAIEIGPGLGALSRHLSQRAGKLVAVEIDPRLIAPLQQVLADAPNSQIIEADAQAVDFSRLEPDWPGETVVLANLPYYITTPIIEKLVCERPQARQFVFMVQKEAAERLLAQPGSKLYGPTAVLLAWHGPAQRLFPLLPQSFWPKPHVDSVVISIGRKPNADPETAQQRKHWLRFLNNCFRQRRKTLGNNLENIGPILEQLGLPSKVRAEQMSLEQFRQIYDLLQSSK